MVRNMEMRNILKNLITLTGASKKDFEVLREFSPILEEWEKDVVKIFYDTLFEYEPTAKVFQKNERPAREVTLQNWWKQLLSGEYDLAFWEHQWLVGLVHVKREVRNHYMLGMISRLQTYVLDRCFSDFEPVTARMVYGAFKRVTDVIGGLIAEGYFTKYLEAVESAGIKRTVLDRMVALEVDKMLREARKTT
ncbi:MAG: hypothetical protein D6748_16310 [Calditrichaeota bacterium]|nr:MAG: hypothetical protein D6748_16310 [Calditrichota bacterium]